MHRFEVWAPRAHTMAVSINGATLPMNGPDDRSSWWLDVAQVGPGNDYGFLIDGDKTPWPDPRSQWQPNGVHGLSRVYDQRAFMWSDHGFVARPLSSGVIYELHVGTFTAQGTLDAAIEKLGELCELGITHVELMPMASFPGRQGWGYDGVAISAVHEPYGGPDALKRFVDAAHKSGLAVLLDVVYNHFGPVGNYTGKFGPYVDDKHHTPWGGAVNLEDAGAREVRRFFCDNALMWLRDFHIDGLRIDAVHAFVDRSAIHFLEQLATEVESLKATSGRNLVLIAESDLNDPRFVTPREANGLGMDAQWSDDFHHSLFAVLTGLTDGYYADFGSLGQLAKALEQTFVYDGVYSGYRQRVHGRPVRGLSQHRFLGYIQNHDQVGNRAIGDRLSHIAGMERAKIAAAIVLLGPFIPMLFQGEEWACTSPFQYFVDHEPEMAKLVSEGRRKEFAAFGWEPESIPDPQSPATFERSKLNWKERAQPEQAAMLKWHRDLIALRRSTPCLNNGEQGNTRAMYSEDRKWIRFDRGSIAVICNLAKESRSFTVSQKDRLLLASCGGVSASGAEMTLPPESVAVLQK
jgi:maltooligosyltrehalose trehalohydrolase